MTAGEAATRYAGLAAIEAGVSAAKRQAGEDLRLIAATSGLTKGEVATQFGAVTLAENRGSTTVVIADEDAFLAWAQANHADAVETVTRLRAQHRAAIVEDRFTCVAGQVVDTVTGEVVPFARVYVTEAQPPSPSYRASDLQRQAKRAAVDYIAGRAHAFVQGVTDMLAIDSGDAE